MRVMGFSLDNLAVVQTKYNVGVVLVGWHFHTWYFSWWPKLNSNLVFLSSCGSYYVLYSALLFYPVVFLLFPVDPHSPFSWSYPILCFNISLTSFFFLFLSPDYYFFLSILYCLRQRFLCKKRVPLKQILVIFQKEF